MKLYANECFNRKVVEHLRAQGHDVLTTQEAGNAGRSDAHAVAFATAAGRAVLTFNRTDFIRLARRDQAHAGIIVCTEDPNTEALASRIHVLLQSDSSLSGKLIRINRPAK